MTRIISALPGRIRIRDGALRHPGRNARLAATLAAALAELAPALDVTTNPAAGSVLVRFDPDGQDLEALEACIDAAVDQELSRPRPTVPPSVRVRINRAAKAGMLFSLATSLALAATGNKRAHALAGTAFVACLGVHLAVHRKHLLR